MTNEEFKIEERKLKDEFEALVLLTHHVAPGPLTSKAIADDYRRLQTKAAELSARYRLDQIARNELATELVVPSDQSVIPSPDSK